MAHQREHLLDQQAELTAVLYYRTPVAPASTAAPTASEGDHTDIRVWGRSGAASGRLEHLNFERSKFRHRSWSAALASG